MFGFGFVFFKSFFQSRPMELNAHNILSKRLYFCKRVANLVKQDRNVFPSAIVRRLEKCVQETWDMAESSLSAIIRMMSLSARYK